VRNLLRTEGHLVKQEQWERWRAKQKLVSGSKHGDAYARVRGYYSRDNFEIVYAKSSNLEHFGPNILGRKTVRNAVHDAFLNSLTMGTAFPCVLAGNDPLDRTRQRSG